MTSRVLAVLTLAITMFATAAAPVASTADVDSASESIGWELVRTRLDAPAGFSLSIGHSPAEGEPFGAAVALRTDRDGRVESGFGFFASSFGRQTQPTVSSGGTSVNPCTVADECTPVVQALASSSFFGYEDDGTDGYNRVYVEFENVNVSRADFEGDGWVLRQVDDLFDATYVGLDDAQTLDVALAGTTGVGVLTHAELDGADGGSIAFSLPPCSTKRGLPIGVGSITLSGGSEDASTSCDQTALHSVLPATAFTESGTRWVVDGFVAGDTSFKDVPLVSFALPHCSSRIPGVEGRASSEILEGTGCSVPG